MEVNKDEADRCIEIGAAAMNAGDIARAEKFLNKAEKLFPTQRAKGTLGRFNGMQLMFRASDFFYWASYFGWSWYLVLLSFAELKCYVNTLIIFHSLVFVRPNFFSQNNALCTFILEYGGHFIYG